MDGSNHFHGKATATAGSNSIPIVATDIYGQQTSKHIQVNVEGDASRTLTYDLNGNITFDGTRIFEWDAANRCVAISEGSHRTETSYDGFGREARRVEKEHGVTTSTRQFLWCGLERVEERDGSNNVIKRFFPQGERIQREQLFLQL